MFDFTARNQVLLGDEVCEVLAGKCILIVGLGGVGSYAAEACARAGFGKIVLVDHDTVDLTNLNRQLIALRSTLGRPKAIVCAERLRDINPEAEIVPYQVFCAADTLDGLLSEHPDCILDCIDTVTAKLLLITAAERLQIPIISALGTGRKTDPTQLRFCDIFETRNDALARVMRRELRKRGIGKLRVICSEEEAKGELLEADKETGKRSPGSISWVPGCAGLMMAGEAVKMAANAANK